MKNKGVTLIEIIIVLAIIGILLSIAIPVVNGKSKPRPSQVVFVEPPPVDATPSLTEECVGGFAFIRGEGTLIQKLGTDGLPAQC